MNTLRVLHGCSFVLSLLLWIPLFAQAGQDKTVAQVSKTEICGHFLGETAQEFLTKSNLLGRLASCRATPPKLWPESTPRCGALVAAADVGSAVIEFEVAPPTYVFEEGKLSKVWMRLGPFAENFRFLTEKYGNPAIQNQEPVLTPYGTTWQLVRAEWHMPDGAVIRAWESIVRTRPLNIAALETLTRVTSIEFSSKEEIERVKSKEARKPNPLN